MGAAQDGIRIAELEDEVRMLTDLLEARERDYTEMAAEDARMFAEDMERVRAECDRLRERVAELEAEAEHDGVFMTNMLNDVMGASSRIEDALDKGARVARKLRAQVCALRKERDALNRRLKELGDLAVAIALNQCGIEPGREL